ncbi:MAG TPA: amino acid permease [Rhizomicrobium sp.]|nr:amino acid permease [Rhizomicrobium sp.]
MPDDRKKLGPFLAVVVVAGTMIGSGVYLLPASLGAVGSISILAWLIGAFGAGLIATVFAMLALASPETSGLFSYVRNGFGPCAGFVAAALYWFSCVPGNVAVALAVTGYLSVFVPMVAKPPTLTIATIAVIWLLLGANAVGPKFVAKLQSWTALVGLAPVLFTAIAGWFWFHGATFAQSWNVSGDPALTVVPRTTVMVFWAFVGIEGAILLAVRLRNPGRDVPIGTLGGLAVAAMIYIGASAAIMGILPAAVLAKSAAPFADAAAPALGASVAGAVALCAMLKATGTLGGSLLFTVETAECESCLGSLREAPPPQSAYRVSLTNIVLTGVVETLAVIVSVSPSLARQFTVVTNVAVVLTVMVYIGASLSLLRLSSALSAPQRTVARVVAVLAVLFGAWLIYASERDLLIWSVGAVVLALTGYVPVYLRTSRRAKLLAEA